MSDPTWQQVVEEYDNIDNNTEGGRLRHKPCRQVIARAFLNRETLELLVAHMDECAATREAAGPDVHE